MTFDLTVIKGRTTRNSNKCVDQTMIWNSTNENSNMITVLFGGQLGKLTRHSRLREERGPNFGPQLQRENSKASHPLTHYILGVVTCRSVMFCLPSMIPVLCIGFCRLHSPLATAKYAPLLSLSLSIFVWRWNQQCHLFLLGTQFWFWNQL